MAPWAFHVLASLCIGVCDRILVSSAMSVQAWVKTVWSDVEWVLQIAHGHVFVRSGIRLWGIKKLSACM